MADHIRREDAVKIIEEKQKELCPVGRYGRNYVYGSDREKYDAWEEIIDALENLPAADVAEVRHGRWIWNKAHCKWKCSECGGQEGECEPPICKWCGARMDKEK